MTAPEAKPRWLNKLRRFAYFQAVVQIGFACLFAAPVLLMGKRSLSWLHLPAKGASPSMVAVAAAMKHLFFSSATGALLLLLSGSALLLVARALGRSLRRFRPHLMIWSVLTIGFLACWWLYNSHRVIPALETVLALEQPAAGPLPAAGPQQSNASTGARETGLAVGIETADPLRSLVSKTALFFSILPLVALILLARGTGPPPS